MTKAHKMNEWILMVKNIILHHKWDMNFERYIIFETKSFWDILLNDVRQKNYDKRRWNMCGMLIKLEKV